MAARRILFVEASTGGVVGGSLTGILHLIPRLDRARFQPLLALYEAKHVAANGPPERLTSRWLEACICMTEEIEAHCRARHLRARRLLTIYDGIDTAAFAPGGGAAVRRELGIPPDAPLAGIVGHIQDWKGQHLVVEAVARAPARFPELRCLLLGGVHRRGAEHAERIHERIARPDLAGHVVLTGARHDLPACLDAMDGVIHPSVVAEPL